MSTKLLTLIIAVAIAMTCLSCLNQNHDSTNEDSGSDDLLEIDQLKSILNANEVQAFLHQDLPDRKQLSLAGPQLPLGAEFIAKAQSVRVIGDSCLNSSNCMEIRIEKHETDTMWIKLSYPLEGVRGDALLIREASRWQLKTIELVEES